MSGNHPLHVLANHIHLQTPRPNLIIGSSHCRLSLPLQQFIFSPNRAPFDSKILKLSNVDARGGRTIHHLHNIIIHSSPQHPLPTHLTTPREVIVIFLGGNDLSNLLPDQFLATAMLTHPPPPLHKLYISITIFNLVSEIVTVHDYFSSTSKHVKICSLIHRPSMPSHLSALVTRINLQLLNRLPNNTLIDTYNSIQTRHICTDHIHLKKSGQDILYNRIKAAIKTHNSPTYPTPPTLHQLPPYHQFPVPCPFHILLLFAFSSTPFNLWFFAFSLPTPLISILYSIIIK